MGFLTDLTDEIRRAMVEHPLDESQLLARAQARPPARDALAAIRGARPSPAVIAEVKRASPSAGSIAPDTDPAAQAQAYADAGAAVISVLTEPTSFHGSLTDLEAVRLQVHVPVLRKDFLVHPAQVIEARAQGADAVLLIVASVSQDELVALLALTRDLGMSALVESHGEDDLVRALDTDAELIGVNARDLETLEIDVERAIAALARVPSDRLAVLESGISSRADVVAAERAGASAILVGEALMRAGDPGRTLRTLVGEEM
jgi:indole-3-glycerol phosphate synthase